VDISLVLKGAEGEKAFRKTEDVESLQDYRKKKKKKQCGPHINHEGILTTHSALLDSPRM